MGDWSVWNFVIVDISAAASAGCGFRVVGADVSLLGAGSVTPEIVTGP
jgi:hypothetical protein